MVTHDRLREVLSYSPYTGVFTWRLSRGHKPAGSTAGTIRDNGYVYIGIDGKTYLAHRLAWLFVTGSLPENQIDHINRIRSDNRISNLRPATSSENSQNRKRSQTNTSGITGVTWDMRHQKWRAQIMINGRQIYLGLYKDVEDAAAARSAAKTKSHIFNPMDSNEKAA